MTAIMKDQYQWLCVSVGGPCYRYDCRKIKQKHKKKDYTMKFRPFLYAHFYAGQNYVRAMVLFCSMCKSI